MSPSIYVKLLIVFLAAVITLWLIPLSEFVQGMIAIPGVGALVGALVQIARDSAQFERQQFLQLDQQIFSLGASSHMSSVAFDKHVSFCEEYMAQVHETVGTLFKEGPTPKALDCAQELFTIKREYAAWIPKTISLSLEPFESAVRQIGVKSQLVKDLGSPDKEARSKAIDESFALFCNVMGLSKLKESDPDHKEEIAVENVKDCVRQILGISDLVEIRNFIVRRSAEYAKRHSLSVKKIAPH